MSNIHRTLADTTKSGQLLFPEFALAMYLCNLALNGKSLPTTLPERVKNEVSSMVDIISFAIPDEQSSAPANSNAPNFTDAPKQSSFASASVQQPAPQQPSSSQLLSQLVAQPTSFQPQQTGFQSQPNALMPQPTGYMQPQPTGFGGPMQPMTTGFQPTAAPLNAQPTGRPGQWGLVNAPAAGLPNLDLLQAQMMPQAGRETGFSATGLRGNATVPWAVTKDEKKIYDNMFRAWDGFGKGYISGNQALEIFGQSGLNKSDLEKVWTLSDAHNKGRLDLDEFAVAMHLIYRALNGYPVPNRLPPELVPPSTRNLTDSLSSMKSLLNRDAEERKSSGGYLQPQQTGVSYLKSHSFRDSASPASNARKDATVYKYNDDSSGYKSSARRRVNANGRSESPDSTGSSASAEPTEDLSIEQLKKRVREKQVLLDAIDFQDENKADEDSALDRIDKHAADELYERIRNIQEDIDRHPKSGLRASDSDAERRTLLRQLRSLSDRLPELVTHARKAEQAIADARLELFRLKDAKANPGGAPPIVNTGPGGAVTESDRLKARARAMMQARSAALSGKAAPADTNDAGAATKRLEEEKSKVASERESNERMVKDVEEGITTFSKGVEDSLKEGGESAADEHDKRRWQEGLGVEDEVREFIYDLQRSSRSSRVRREDTSRPATTSSSSARLGSPAPRTSAPQSSGSYSAYKTAEDRAAFIKQQAEQRMAERLAALGISRPPKAGGGETPQQRQEREQKEREDRKRQAEAEDAAREQDRQRRLAGEQISPPSAQSKKPAPPAPTPRVKPRSGSAVEADKSVIGAAELKQEERAQDAQVKELE